MRPGRFLHLEPSGECALRCPMCPIRLRRDAGPESRALMPWDLYKRILDSRPGLRTLRLQGLGEPLLHPRLPEMVQLAVSRGIRVSVGTSGVGLDRASAERLVRSGVSAVHVSLDGATAETYEGIRLGGRFFSALRALALLRRTKRRLGVRRPELALVFVAMKRNVDELPALVRLARRVGAASVFVRHVRFEARGPALSAAQESWRDYVGAETLADEDPARVRAYFERAREAAAECGIRLQLPLPRPRDGAEDGASCVSYRGQTLPRELVPPADLGRGTIGRWRRLRSRGPWASRRARAPRRPARGWFGVAAAVVALMLAARGVVAKFPAQESRGDELFSGLDDGSALEATDGWWDTDALREAPLAARPAPMDPERWAEY